MDQREWTFVNKTDWPEGPWQSEPDKVQWIDEATGLDCLIHRGPSGALCGYVGLPPGHKYHGSNYDSVYEYNEDGSFPDVHGGLTFSDKCADKPREDGGGICHIPEPGRPADVWWLGFDCAHSGDLCPAHERRWREMGLSVGETYRSLACVRREVESLARQLASKSST